MMMVGWAQIVNDLEPKTAFARLTECARSSWPQAKETGSASDYYNMALAYSQVVPALLERLARTYLCAR